MADRSLRFNIFADDRASQALDKIARNLDKLGARVTGLDHKKALIRVEADIRKAERDLDHAERKVKEMSGEHKIRVQAEIDINAAELDKLKVKLAELTRKREIKLDVRADRAKTELRAFERELADVMNERHDALIGISSKTGEIDKLREQLRSLGAQKATPLIDIRTAAIRSQIGQLKKEIGDLGRLSPEIRVAIRADERKLGSLQAQLEKLGREAPSIDVDLKTAALEAKISRVEERIRSLQRTEPIELGANTARLDTAITQARAKLEQLEAVRTYPELDADHHQLMEKIAEAKVALEALDKQKASPEIDVDIAAAMAEVEVIRAEINSLHDKKVEIKIDRDKGFGSLASVMGRLSAGFVGLVNNAGRFTRSLGVIAVPIGIAALIPAVISLGASLEDLIGIAGLLPGAFSVGGLALGTLAIGFSGFKNAMAKLDTPKKIEKYNEALRDMAPSARDTVAALRGLGGEWTKLRNAVQGPMFQGVAGDIKALAKDWLPLMSRGFAGVGSSFNLVFRNLASFFKLKTTIADFNFLFEATAKTIRALAPGIKSFVGAFTNIAVVGASMLPMLGKSFSGVMQRFEEFTAKARADGSMAAWIARGITSFQKLWGAIKETGKVLSNIFAAARLSSYSFVDSWRGAMQEINEGSKSFIGLNTMAGKLELGKVFDNMREAVARARDGIGSLLDAIFKGAQSARPLIMELANTFSTLAASLGPALSEIAKVQGTIFVPVLQGIQMIAGAMDGWLPKIIALAVAWKSIQWLTGFFIGFVGIIGRAGAAMGAFAVSSRAAAMSAGMMGPGMTRFNNAVGTSGLLVSRAATGLRAMGAALPFIGIALVGLSMLMDEFGDKSKEFGEKAAQGMMGYKEAVDAAYNQIMKTKIWTTEANRAEIYQFAVDGVNKSLAEQQRTMSSLQVAQSNQAQIERDLNIARNSGNTPEVIRLEKLLAEAKKKVADETKNATLAEESYGDALKASQQIAEKSINTQLGLEGALLNYEAAQKRAKDALTDHGKASIEYRQAAHDEKESALAVANAAREAAEAHAIETGATNAAQQGSDAYTDSLVGLAKTAGGETKLALQELILKNANAKVAHDDGTGAAKTQRDALFDLGRTASGQTKVEIDKTIASLDTISKSHKSAEEKADLQKKELKRLADMMPEPVRGEINRMIADLNKIPPAKSTSISVHGTMDWASGMATITPGKKGEVAGAGGAINRATGGTLPGFSPGRDVHSFYSPTGGRLELSGGEAVMRPEWTAAMGKDYVDAANFAARAGGVDGVRDFIAATAGDDDDDDQSFAFGGRARFRRVMRRRRRPVRRRIRRPIRRVAAPRRQYGFHGNSYDPRLHSRGGMRFNPDAELDTSHITFHPGYRDTMPRKADGGILDDVQSFRSGGTVDSKNPPFTTMPSRTYAQMANAMLDQMMQKLIAEAKKVGSTLAPPGGLGGGGGGAGVARWAGMVSQALGMMGQPQAYSGITLRRMNQESGGNPTIVNRVDSNWRAGHPSVGLMQVIRGTYQAYKKIDTGPYLYGVSVNPLANTLASMNYALRVYGSLPRAYNKAGGYAKGGVIATKIADRGGMVNHGQAFLNLSGRAERALTGRQNENLEQIANADRYGYTGSPDVVAAIYSLGRMLGNGGNVFNNVFPITGSPQQTAREVASAQRDEAALGAWGSR